MADPKPTIRVEGVCRADGRCPVCGQPGLSLSWAKPCGCRPCGYTACHTKHTEDLLTEALRQLSQVKDVAADAIVKWRRYEDDYILPCFTKAEDAGINLKRLVSKQAGRNCVEILVDTLREERDAGIRRLKAMDLCTVCAGTGKPVSGTPCICGGHGGIGNQIIGLTREAFKERERAEKAEALLRRAHVWVAQEAVFSSSPATRERAGALADEIHEALPK